MGTNNQNDISDIQSKNAASTANTIVSLPIRGEKQIVPSPISSTQVTQDATTSFGSAGLTIPQSISGPLSQSGAGFTIEAATSTLTDYVMIRIQNRGLDATGTQPDPTQPLVYRFLINPKTVNIAHATLDSQTLTRSGWQFGVWGEDLVNISMSGSTAGQYFFLGLTDAYAEFTESYRNLVQLQMSFENNGYWFEGESIGEGPLAANAARRRIKMQNDVELVVGDFIWYGCFETLQINQDAENPFLARFNLSFIAWKERFRGTSPYWNDIENNVQRGHSYSVYSPLVNQSQQGTPPTNVNTLLTMPPTPPVPPQGTTPPAVQDEQLYYTTVPPTESDHSVSPQYVLGNNSDTGEDFWQV
jgi:hypothetical protein